MNKRVWAITKLNLKNIRTAYFITGLLFVMMIAQIVVDIILAARGHYLGDNAGVSLGWFLWAAVALAAVLVPARNFRRVTNLGGKRDGFRRGSFTVYAILSGAISLASTVIYYALDQTMFQSGKYGYMLSAPDVFGWAEHGAAAVFFQQFAFLLLLAMFIHTLTSLQDKWYGWAADIVLVAIISVFPPIAPLRSVLAGFFWIILFSPLPLQIGVCLLLTAALYALSKPVYVRKAI
ncbi:MAG: hypothetical protein LBL36_00505 [Clostridiales Family XIII bacterium]|jgi:hypothetical protein|nr:hypothetical protein [Clostridiales Family XIII bacterium]